MWQRLYLLAFESRIQFGLQCALLVILFAFADLALADDLLKDSQVNLKDTVMGTGKLFIYLIEAVIAIALYMKTRNLMVFLGVIIIAVFVEIVTKKFLGA
jgi:hypothetical protein